MTSWKFDWVDESKFDLNRESMTEDVSKFVEKWSDDSFKTDSELLKLSLVDYESIWEKHGYGGEEGYYYWLLNQLDLNDKKVRSKLKSISDFTRDNFNKLNFFRINLGKLSEKDKNKFLEDEELSYYYKFLKDIFDMSKHRLSESEEKIMSLKQDSGYSMWKKMLSSLISKETRKVNNEEKTFEQLISDTLSEDKKIRDHAKDNINDILNKYSEVAENEINAILNTYEVNDKIRGYSRADSARLLSDSVDEKFVDILVKTVSDNFEISNKYYDLKSKLMNQKLGYHEKSAQIGKLEKEYSFDESKKIIGKVLNNLDSEFKEVFDRFEKDGRLDVYPDIGKRGGAFCVHMIKKLPTYILLNHTNDLSSLKTLAHEVGHGINNELTRDKQNEIYFGTATSTAEVASTFFEDFVFEEILKRCTDEERLVLMIQKLGDEISTIMRQIAAYNFETELHSEYRKNKYLSCEEIGLIFKKNMKEYLGDSVDCSWCDNWWIYWSHFRNRFYVYSYASGLLISKALQRKVRSDKNFIGEIKKFLASGTSKSPKEIFIAMGIDIYSKEFWEEGLNEINETLKDTISLAKKLGKI